MIDFKKTLTNLHDEFPDLDTLFKILDARNLYSYNKYSNNIRQPSDKPWWNDINRITYNAKVKQANLISRLAYFVI